MTEPFRYTDPAGDVLEIRPGHGGSVVLTVHDTATDERTGVSLLVRDFEPFVTALYEKAGLPVPELAAQVGSVTMQPGEDWHKVVDRAGRQHASVYPDPAEVARAAAWAGEFSG